MVASARLCPREACGITLRAPQVVYLHRNRAEGRGHPLGETAPVCACTDLADPPSSTKLGAGSHVLSATMLELLTVKAAEKAWRCGSDRLSVPFFGTDLGELLRSRAR